MLSRGFVSYVVFSEIVLKYRWDSAIYPTVREYHSKIVKNDFPKLNIWLAPNAQPMQCECYRSLDVKKTYITRCIVRGLRATSRAPINEA